MHTTRPHYRAAAKTAMIVALLALCTAPVLAQEILWQKYLEDGYKAYVEARYAEAERLCNLTVTEAEKFGSADPRLELSLNNLAEVYQAQGKYDQAEPLYKRALAIRETALGPEHPDVAQSLNNMAEVYKAQGKYDRAEPLYERSLAIREKALGPEHPDVAQSLENYGDLLKATARADEAQAMLDRAAAIRMRSEKP